MSTQNFWETDENWEYNPESTPSYGYNNPMSGFSPQQSQQANPAQPAYQQQPTDLSNTSGLSQIPQLNQPRRDPNYNMDNTTMMDHYGKPMDWQQQMNQTIRGFRKANGMTGSGGSWSQQVWGNPNLSGGRSLQRQIKDSFNQSGNLDTTQILNLLNKYRGNNVLSNTPRTPSNTFSRDQLDNYRNIFNSKY